MDLEDGKEDDDSLQLSLIAEQRRASIHSQDTTIGRCENGALGDLDPPRGNAEEEQHENCQPTHHQRPAGSPKQDKARRHDGEWQHER